MAAQLAASQEGLSSISKYTFQQNCISHSCPTEIHVALSILHHNAPHYSLNVTENKWLMELITADKS
jgi:hypothetical protein